MSKELWFEGYSDDTFGEMKAFGEDHDNCASGYPMAFAVEAGVEGFVVIGQYANGHSCGWQIAVAPLDGEGNEERHIPQWPMRFERSDREYSPRLVITAPDDVSVRYVP